MGKALFKNKYHGTYSSDQLPNLNAKSPYAIVNVDKSTQSGSHWVAVFYHKKKYLIFDSFGRKTKALIPAMYKKWRTVDTDYDANQLEKQNDCGPRSAAFLKICDEFGWDSAKLI